MRPFNNLRLAYLDDLENDPEVQEAIKPSGRYFDNTDMNTFENYLSNLYDQKVTVAFWGIYQRNLISFNGTLINPEDLYDKIGNWKEPRPSISGHPRKGSIVVKVGDGSMAHILKGADTRNGEFIYVGLDNNLILQGTREEIEGYLANV